MSRYPFEEFSNEFMVSVKGIYSDAHHKGLVRRYRRIGRDLRTLHAEGKISTTSPKTMTPEDVKACFVHKKGLGHSAREYAHEVNAFILLFDYVGNMAVRTCLSRYPMLKPVSDHSRLPTISDSDRKRISEGMKSAVSSEDSRLIRSYAMLAIFLGCGPRTKELRLMDLKDLDTEEWTLDILHVKGEGRYGSPRTVPVPPGYRSIISAYLSIRPETGSPALFPPSMRSARGSTDPQEELRPGIPGFRYRFHRIGVRSHGPFHHEHHRAVLRPQAQFHGHRGGSQNVVDTNPTGK